MNSLMSMRIMAASVSKRNWLIALHSSVCITKKRVSQGRTHQCSTSARASKIGKEDTACPGDILSYLAHAGGAQKKKRGNRAIALRKAGAIEANSVADGSQCMVLAHDAALKGRGSGVVSSGVAKARGPDIHPSQQAPTFSSSSIRSSLARSLSSIVSTGIPVARDTTWAMSSAVT